MPEIIDRDFEEIIKYAGIVGEYYENTQQLLHSAHSMMSTYMSAIEDMNSVNLVNKFGEESEDLKLYLESYKELSDKMKADAQRLQDIIDEFTNKG